MKTIEITVSPKGETKVETNSWSVPGTFGFLNFAFLQQLDITVRIHFSLQVT